MNSTDQLRALLLSIEQQARAQITVPTSALLVSVDYSTHSPHNKICVSLTHFSGDDMLTRTKASRDTPEAAIKELLSRLQPNNT